MKPAMALSRLLHRSFSTSEALKPPHDRFLLYKKGNIDKMVRSFKKFSDKDWFRAQSSVYDKTVLRLARSRRQPQILEILEHQKKYDDFTDEKFAARIIKLYGRSNMFKFALKTFDELPERNCPRTVMSLNSLLESCVRNKGREILKYFRELPPKLSITPNAVSYGLVVKGFCSAGSFDSAIGFLEEMDKDRMVPDLSTFNFLLSHLRRSTSRIPDMEKVWDRMAAANVTPNASSYLSWIIAMVGAKKLTEAASWFEEMERKGVKPTDIIFDVLIKGCCLEGDLRGAERWYDRTVACRLAPRKETFWRMIKLACQEGDFDLVEKLVKRIFAQKCLVGQPTLQVVVDELVQKSRVEAAEKIVRQAKSSAFGYALNMPSK